MLNILNMFDFLKNIFGNGGKSEPFQGGYNAEEWVYYAKGSYDNAIEYNNEIICVTEKLQGNMEMMNEAMDAEEYREAELVRQEFQKSIAEYKAEIDRLGKYEGEAMLLDAAHEYFDAVQNLMNTGYKTLIDMRRAGKRGAPEEQNQLAQNNSDFLILASEFNRVSDAFLALYDNDGVRIDSSFSNPHIEDFQKNAENNPVLADIEGVSLEDYAAAAAFLANGWNEARILEVLGIDAKAWEKANALWTERMQTDQSFAVMTAYGQYFAAAAAGNKFADSSENVENPYLKRLQKDEEFYHELEGARQAAYEAGFDGVEWMKSEYGISLGDFQVAAMKWMTQNTTTMDRMLAYQALKKAEYAKKFAMTEK